MKVLLVILLMAVTSSYASDKGNGGDGLMVNGKLYLLDFIEAGIETSAYIDESLIDEEISAVVNKSLGHLPNLDTKLVSAKLTELKQVDPIMSKLLVIGLTKYSWRVVNQAIFDVYDEDSPLDVEPENFIQLALRRDSYIYMKRSTWDMLDAKNKVGLIFHELIYAMMPFEWAPKGITGKRCATQNSYRARSINGDLFLRPVDLATFDNSNLFPNKFGHQSSRPSMKIINASNEQFIAVEPNVFLANGKQEGNVKLDLQSPTLLQDIQNFVKLVHEFPYISVYPEIAPNAKSYRVEFFEVALACSSKASTGLRIINYYAKEWNYTAGGPNYIRSVEFPDTKELTVPRVQAVLQDLAAKPTTLE